MPTAMYQQPYHLYTIQQQQTWNILYTKRSEALSAVVSAPFWAGVNALELKAYFIPDFQKLNFHLREQKSEWEVMAVEEPLRPRQVLAKWAKQKFPAVTSLRLHPDADLRLQGNKDLFQDVFSQLPWLLQPEVADFMERIGQLSLHYKDPAATELLWRLAQHVLGNGLLRDQDGKVTLFGAYLLSNAPEGEAALKRENAWQPAVLEEILGQPYKSGETDRYFVLESLSELHALAAQLEKEGFPMVEISAQLQLIAG
jgi:phenylalanine-4-hydroxylase